MFTVWTFHLIFSFSSLHPEATATLFAPDISVHTAYFPGIFPQGQPVGNLICPFPGRLQFLPAFFGISGKTSCQCQPDQKICQRMEQNMHSLIMERNRGTQCKQGQKCHYQCETITSVAPFQPAANAVLKPITQPLHGKSPLDTGLFCIFSRRASIRSSSWALKMAH